MRDVLSDVRGGWLEALSRRGDDEPFSLRGVF